MTTVRAPTGVILFARSRGWLVVAAGIAGVAIASWWAAAWLSSFQGFWYPEARVPVTAAAPLMVAVLVSRTLDSPDVDLDRSLPVPWMRLSVVNVLGWTALGVGLLALAATREPLLFGSVALIRNVLGYVGLTCLGAVAIGARLSWLPGLTIAFALYLGAPRMPTAFDRWWAWPMQDGAWDGSWVVAITLFAIGMATYAYRGPKRIPVT